MAFARAYLRLHVDGDAAGELQRRRCDNGIRSVAPGSTVTAISGTGWSCSPADDNGPAVCQRAYDTMSDASGTPFPDISVDVTFASSPPVGDLINTAFVDAKERNR